MLHADRDMADRSRAEGREQPRDCPGRQAEIAARYAGILALRPESRDFARQFFLALAERSQWDFCLEAALHWCGDGLERFPRDAELLLTAGSVHEEAATLLSPAMGLRLAIASARQREATRKSAGERDWWLKQARRYLSEAVAADEGLVLARVRLGRILWRLGEGDAARAALEAAIERSTTPGDTYLARLFLGRVHEDARQLGPAVEQYSLAVELEPQGQSAAVALSHALRLTGDAAGAVRVLRESVAHAGRRAARDVYWDYLAGNAASADERFAELRRETLE